jgi:hypothetical protein
VNESGVAAAVTRKRRHRSDSDSGSDDEVQSETVSDKLFMEAMNQGYGDVASESDSADSHVKKRSRGVGTRSRRALFNGGEPVPVSFKALSNSSGTGARQAATKAAQAMKGMR